MHDDRTMAKAYRRLAFHVTLRQSDIAIKETSGRMSRFMHRLPLSPVAPAADLGNFPWQREVQPPSPFIVARFSSSAWTSSLTMTGSTLSSWAFVPAGGPDGYFYRLFPYLQQYQGDLQEFATVSLTRGHKALQPCPKCTISNANVSNQSLQAHRQPSLRSHNKLRQALREKRTDQYLKQHGLWGQKNALFKVTDNVHQALAVDPLHQFDLGIIDYVVTGTEQLIILTRGPAAAKACLRELYDRTSIALPPYQAVTSRSSSLLAVDPAKKKSLRAYEWNDFSKVCIGRRAFLMLVPS
ncbi:hypothetical protein BCR44DRAFT_322761, partial [Catenaria anguillulae PL171]